MSDNLYTMQLIKELKKEFKIVTLLFRGSDCGGVPITSKLLCHPGSWRDVKEGVEQVGEKYVKDKLTGKKRCRYYVYGCSMGVGMLVLYLIHSPDTANNLIDATVLYGTPWDYNQGMTHYNSNYGGWPSYLVAMNVCRLTRAYLLP